MGFKSFWITSRMRRLGWVVSGGGGGGGLCMRSVRKGECSWWTLMKCYCYWSLEDESSSSL